MALDKKCVYLRGRQSDFNEVGFTALMEAEVGVSSSAAKNLTDKLLAGETVILWVSDLRKTIDQACSFGAIVLDYPRSADAN